MSIRSFRDLDAWKVSMDLVVLTYSLARQLPPTERYELSAQIRSAAVSIPANLAEGHATGKARKFLYHTRIALGSLGELETELELATRLGMLTPEELPGITATLARTGQLLHGLVRSLERTILVTAVGCLALLVLLPSCYIAFAIFR